MLVCVDLWEDDARCWYVWTYGKIMLGVGVDLWEDDARCWYVWTYGKIMLGVGMCGPMGR